jgi:hypothetical protein
MTYPTEFREENKKTGATAIKHPIYKFKVNLNRLRNEAVGPVTNQRSVNLLHPDMHDNSPDRGRTNAAEHQKQYHAWLPSLFPGKNIDIKDDGTIVAYGAEAVYLKKTYADVANPLLTLVNSAPYTSEN